MWSFRKEIHKYGIGLLPDPPCSLGMDVAFLIDYTGSMGGVIDTVKSSVSDIVDAIDTEVGSGNYRLGLVISDEYLKGANPNYNASAGYVALPPAQKNINTTGATTNQYNTAMELFSPSNEATFTTQLNLLNTGAFPLGNGQGAPEPLDMALDFVANFDFLGSLRINVAKYVLIFTDAPPGGDDDIYNAVDDAKIATLTADCIAKKIKVIVIGGGAALPVWQGLATGTGGSFNTSFDSEVIISQIIATCQNLIPPTAVAGIDQVINLPSTTTVLDGSGSSDADGTIVTYLWELISGTGGTIVTPNSAVTNVTGLSEGVYVYRLTVTDNDGLTDTDFITTTVQAPSIACGSSQAFTSPSGAGVYYTVVELGTDTGLVTVDYDAASIPDRFQVLYDGVIVADSLHVGDFLTGNPPDANTALWEGGAGSGQFVGHAYNNIEDFTWDGIQYTGTGVLNNNTVLQSDVAPFGQTAGAGTLSFNKTSSSPTTATIIVTSFPANTGWDFTVNCPVEIQTLNFGTSSVLNNFQMQQAFLGTTGTVNWDVTGGVTDNQTGTHPTFDLSTNIGVADFVVEGVTGLLNVTLFGGVPTRDVEYIDVTELVDLQTLDIRTNNVSVLDVTNNLNLVQLLLGNNNVSTIDVTNNPGLTSLDVNNNNLTALNVVNNVDLINLSARNNNISTLSVATNIDLELLQISNMNLTTLDISNNTLITNLQVSGNPLSAVSIDNILIQLDSHGLSGGSASIPLGRTVASDAALLSLQGKGWTVNEI